MSGSGPGWTGPSGGGAESGDSGPAPGTPAYNPTWYAATAVYVDPQNESGSASNNNAGTTAGEPLLTWAEVIRRYGSMRPIFNDGQSCTYTFLSSQSAGADPIFFEPQVSGGGQAILQGTLQTSGVPVAITVDEPKSRAAGGNLLTLATFIGAAAGLLLVNTTRGSQAFIDSVGATVVMQQPFTTASLTSTATTPSPVESDTWASTDEVQPYSLLTLNVKRWCPLGGDETGASAPCGGWVFYVNIADTSGTKASLYPHTNNAACNVLVNCIITPRLHVASEGGRGFQVYIVGCSVLGAVAAVSGTGYFAGGGFAAGGNVYSNPTFDLDCILHGGWGFYAPRVAMGSASGGVYGDGAWTVYAGKVTALGWVWGAWSINLQNTYYENATGSTWAGKALLTSGSIALNAELYGWSFTGSTGLWSAGAVTLTASNLDSLSAAGYSLYGPAGGYVVVTGST